MPFTDFVGEQLLDLENFLALSRSVVRVVRIDPEMRNLFLRLLARLDEKTDFPHVLIGHYETFVDPFSWFTELETALKRQLDELAEPVSEAGIDLDDSQQPEGGSPQRFLLFAEHLTERLPDNIGSLAFVIDPEQVEDAASFARSIEYLAMHVRSPWLKFIVLDDRAAPLLAGLSETSRNVTYQTFWLPPGQMSHRQETKDALAELSSPGKPPRANPFAAPLAFANRDYSRAEALQRARIEDTKETKSPAEQVVDHYNLGSTLLADGRADEAAAVLLSACELAAEHRLNEIAPLVYLNLGIALHRMQQFDQAFAALEVANRFFKAQGNLPGEAFTCDNLALIHHELGRKEDAARTWRYALRVYEGITNPDLEDVREAGCADIRAKLERLGRTADATAE